ncbi:MAG: hypothetical protein AB7O39_03335 [Flavobacteriaceae bacterium]
MAEDAPEKDAAQPVIEALKSTAFENKTPATLGDLAELYALLVRSHDATLGVMLAAHSNSPKARFKASQSMERFLKELGEALHRFGKKVGENG